MAQFILGVNIRFISATCKCTVTVGFLTTSDLLLNNT